MVFPLESTPYETTNKNIQNTEFLSEESLQMIISETFLDNL